MKYTYETRPLRERVGLTVWPANPATTVTTIIEVEDAGVHHIWLPYGPPWNPDLFMVLAAAVARTTRVTLGTAILPISSRHPVLLAQQALAFSGLAPDRLRLGIGTGSPEMAKQIYGEEMGSPLAYLREYLQVPPSVASARGGPSPWALLHDRGLARCSRTDTPVHRSTRTQGFPPGRGTS